MKNGTEMKIAKNLPSLTLLAQDSKGEFLGDFARLDFVMVLMASNVNVM